MYYKNAWLNRLKLYRSTVIIWRDKAKGSMKVYKDNIVYALNCYQFKDLVTDPKTALELENKLKNELIKINKSQQIEPYLYAIWKTRRIWIDDLYPLNEIITNTSKKFHIVKPN